MQQPSDAIVADSLHKSYGEVRALTDLSLRIPAGTTFGLLGPNGAGKSTTIKILSTLARPDGGSAQVCGHDLATEPALVRRRIGVVAQASGVDTDATPRENLRLQARIHGMTGAAAATRIDHLLTRFGLSEAADRIVRGFSGGMVRRLDLAMGLVHHPQVLFLDEPTTGLDPEVRAALWEDIEQLRRDEGLTILLTTHYLEEADRLSHRLAIVDRGTVVVEGTSDELKRSLAGDALHVDVPTGVAIGSLRAALGHLVDLGDLALDGTQLSARAIDGARMVPQLLAALDAAGIPVRTVSVARPSLDDVYLAHTGRHLVPAHSGADHPDPDNHDMKAYR